jgi:CheY-like chemotaxis protein
MTAADATEQLRRAVRIYLDIAYANAPIPKRVEKRLRFPTTDSFSEILHCELFEVPEQNKAQPDSRYRLRLGNCRYPHMKLTVQWIEADQQVIFGVETHDRHIGVPRDSAEAAEFRELQRFNEQLKSAIEEAWQKAGLPTFCDLLSRSNGQTGQVLGRPLVLLVEDQLDILEAERLLLESGGYQVNACPNATSALDALDRGTKPEICVLDIMLPDIDGFELRDRIQRLLGPDIPVMFVTGLPTRLLRERGERVLEKPFSGDELLRTVGLALSRKL